MAPALFNQNRMKLSFKSTKSRSFATKKGSKEVMKRNRNILLITGLVAGTLGAGVLQAQTFPNPAIRFTNYFSGSNPQVGYTIGWDFTVTNGPIFVSHLGYYDYAGDGLGGSHEVGIFDSSGNLLASNTVAAGVTELLVGDPTLGWFRYHALSTDLVLQPGSTYRIGGVGSDNDAAQNSPQNLTVGTRLVLGDSYSTPTGTGVLTFPTTFISGPENPFSGPNFLYIPEPSTVMLFATGGFWLFLRRNRRSGC